MAVRPQLKGIRNVGNSCFLNVVLQSLTSVRHLHMFVSRHNRSASEMKSYAVSPPQSPLAQALEVSMRDLSFAGKGPYDPKKLTTVPMIRQRFMNQEQQDAEELLQMLFSSLDDESEALYRCLVASQQKEAAVPKHPTALYPQARFSQLCPQLDDTSARLNRLFGAAGSSKPPPERLRHPFSGSTVSTLQCSRCKSYSELKADNFNDISLSIPARSCKLEQCLAAFTATERISQVECAVCSMAKAGATPMSSARTDAMKRLQIARPPQALCLHLRRLLMDHRGDLMKTDAEVTFPLKLDLAPFCLFRQGSVEKLLYDLAAVVVHHGNAMGGHFTVFRRVSRTEITNPNLYGAWLSSGGPYKWVHFSDENCQAVTEDTVLRAQPYLLFYERCGPRTAAATEPSKAPSFH